MLILYQDGETAIHLIEPFKIEIERLMTFEKPSECVCCDVVLLQNGDKEILGTYDTPEEAKQTIHQFTKAYERGDLAFRVE